ncbi:hypothetical protein BDW72DRAFT_175641 [Aspergillus terricola var. indicus]
MRALAISVLISFVALHQGRVHLTTACERWDWLQKKLFTVLASHKQTVSISSSCRRFVLGEHLPGEKHFYGKTQ